VLNRKFSGQGTLVFSLKPEVSPVRDGMLPNRMSGVNETCGAKEAALLYFRRFRMVSLRD